MRVLNPPWVHHDGGAIYSAHCHPTASKLATCGQGEIGGNGLVVVWNFDCLLSEKIYSDESVPRVLAKLQHQAGVNSVRWSNDGDLLACASDDKMTTIYEYGGRLKSSGTIGQKGATTVERYKIAHSLHGHCMEVLGVEWSPNGKYLATCSMDNTVMIWNAKKLPERMVVLDSSRGGHTGPVKGISWDPVGRFLATQAADKSVRVWTTDNWQCDQTITKPFEESGQTTMFSRLSWGADGRFLFAPGAMNNQGPVTQIIKRENWDYSMDFVGHRKAVTVAVAHSRLVNYTDKKGDVRSSILVACGSRDKSISIWIVPNVKRPMLVLKNLCKHSIMDFSWKGLDLVVCSQDGTVKMLSFSEEELGPLLSNEDMGDRCEELYKVRPAQFGSEGGDFLSNNLNASAFIDTPEQLLKSKQEEENKATRERNQEEQAARSREAAILVQKRSEQKEVRTVEGKRKIQPIFLGSIADETPVASSSQAPTSSSETSKKTEKPSKRRVALQSAHNSPKKSRIEVSTDDSTTAAESSGEDSSSESDVPMKNSKSKPEEAGTSARSNDHIKQLMGDFKKPMLRRVETTRVEIQAGAAVLDPPEQKAEMSEHVIGVLGATLDISNEWSCAGVRATRVSFMNSQQTRWATFSGPPVIVAVANSEWATLGSADGSLRVLSCGSGRVEWVLQLDSAPVRLGLSHHKAFALTQTGHFSSWDLNKRKSLLSRHSIVDCASKDAHLTALNVTQSGMPLLGFSSGNIYTYSLDMKCWILVDSNSSVLRLSDSLDPLELRDERGTGALVDMLRKKRRPLTLPGVASTVRAGVKESQLEAWLSSARAAGNAKDYRRLLLTYTQILVKHQSLAKLREMMSSLEGDDAICGVRKGPLRTEFMKIVKSDPATSALAEKNRNCVF